MNRKANLIIDVPSSRSIPVEARHASDDGGAQPYHERLSGEL
jgi:hypothetical protein